MRELFKFILLVCLFSGSFFIDTKLFAQVEENIDPSAYLKEEIKPVQEDGGTSVSATVLNKELNNTPISSVLPGYLFEMGYGDMESGLWGEMLFNRQFEPFPPYKSNRDWWYGLRKKGRTGLLCTDWREMDWYHSGYEHNTWYAAPGEVNDHYVDEKSTFFQLENEAGTSQIELMTGDGFMDWYARVINRSSKDGQGIAQNGKYLRKGMGYTFKGHFRNAGKAKEVMVSLYPQGNWENPIATIRIKGLTNKWQEKIIHFENVGYEGFATLFISLSARSAIDMDALSLMPENAVNGWRKDVVEMTRDEIRPGVIRWPGGCYASYYQWKDGIGERDSRPVKTSGHWGGFAYNDVGTLEYLDFCEKVEAEPFICLNLFHPKKEKYYSYFPGKGTGSFHGYDFPEITDLEEGARLAAEWVAYCNLPSGRHPMADLRAKHGREQPGKVKYWELENEAWRWFSDTKEYANACIVYARAMKAVDPTIKLGICAYGQSLSDSLSSILEMAGKYIDFLADRGITDKNISRKIGIIRAYNKRHNTDIKYTNTEFFAEGLDPATIAAQKKYAVNSGKGRNLKTATWGYALSFANIMMQWQRYGGDVIFGCFNSFANDHLNSVIETPKEGAFVKYPAVIGKLFRESPARWSLALKGYEPDAGKTLQVQAAWDKDRENLVVYLFNSNSEEGKVSLNLEYLGKDFRYAREAIIVGPGLATIRSVKEANAMVKAKTEMKDLFLKDGLWLTSVPPKSFVQVELSANPFEN